MKRTKIDWCDCTINPVVGCPRGCPYCYARKMNARFGWVKDFNEPEFFPDRLFALASHKPKSIFMNSMSDVGYWSKEQWEMIIKKIRDNFHHEYIFLTKDKAFNATGLLINNHLYNVHMGITHCGGDFSQEQLAGWFDLLNIEPLLSPVRVFNFGTIKQVIIGAETGNRIYKVVPPKEWVTDIVKECDRAGVRVFMKESLRGIMGADFRQDKLIWARGNCRYEPDIDYPCNNCSSDCKRDCERKVIK